MSGYWLAKGHSPEYIAGLSREDKIVLAAIGRLNQEEEYEMIKKAVIEGAAFIMGKKG